MTDIDQKTIDDWKCYADKHRGKNKTSGPHWPVILRYPILFDAFIETRAQLAEALAENSKMKAQLDEWAPLIYVHGFIKAEGA